MSSSKKAAFHQPEIKKIPAGLMPSGMQFELTFRDLDVRREQFAKFGLTPDGHTWELAVIAHCNENELDISELEFDSESDLFSVFSKSRDSLESISLAIVELVTEEEALQSALCEVDVEEDSPEEVLRGMAIEGRDLSGPVKFDFIMHFRNDSDLKLACQKSTELGYTCFFDDAQQVAICHETWPDLTRLSELHRSIDDVAKEFGGKIEVFLDHDDETDDSYEELDGWALYNSGPVPTDSHQ